MKVKLFIAALSAIVFGACSQSEPETNTAEQAKKTVRFRLDELSRADIRDAQSVYKDGFNFSMIWTGREIYSNAKATWNGSAFDTAPQMFWPFVSEGVPCLFYAVSCPNAMPLSYENGKATFECEVARNAENQQDVLVASVTASEVPDDGVQQMVFSHALTRVNFTVCVDNNEVNANYVWRLSSVSLRARNKGTYTFDAEIPWSVADSYADLEYMNSGQTLDLRNGNTWEGMNNFMLLPQNGEDLTVTLTWTVYFNTGKKLIKVSKADASKSYKISTADWAPGVSKRYPSLRLPNVGENTGSGDNGYDDNNMNGIDYDPDCN